MNTLPTYYIPHGGGPCFFMDWPEPNPWKKMDQWLRQMHTLVGAKPKALLIISAHWETSELAVTAQSQPELLYDYYGFPPHTYELRYDAPGAPALAQQVRELLAQAGFPTQASTERGLDHGVFVPFKLIYPEADIPVVQLSLKAGLDPALHIKVGQALQSLRNEGVLIVGSGMSYHNLRERGGRYAANAAEFDAWLTEASTAEPERRNQMLSQWEHAPSARIAHPREEHLIPLMVAAGAAGDDLGTKVFTDRSIGGTVSAFQFGTSV
jgi:aromatic ring-opening dioxygenase catalytic subunit (LigB family)